MLYNKDWDKPKTPSDILRKAADIMETQGHAKGVILVTQDHAMNHSGVKIGSVCAIGAIMVAAGQMDTEGHWLPNSRSLLASQAQELLVKEIRTDSVPQWAHIPDWNNDPNRPGSEVIATMRAVADKYETVAA